MNSETTDALLDVLANLLGGYRDLLVKLTAAENTLLKNSSDQLRQYEQEIAFAKAQIDTKPQVLALEKLRRALHES
jgi:hypothetical protein